MGEPTRPAVGRPPAALVRAGPAPAALRSPPACTVTAVLLLAWLLEPAPVVALVSGVGLIAHLRDVRRAHLEGGCLLRDRRLVLLYLGSAFVAGVVGTIRLVTA